MAGIATAYTWAVETCNDPTVGYSQALRKGQTKNGITYYDCSSFISAALTQGGFFTKNPWFTTRTEKDNLLKAGFTQFDPKTQPWMNGDILWRSGHTEMVYSAADYITMGAHTSNAALEDQVSINTVSGEGKWTRGFRAPSVGGYEWVVRVADDASGYLSDAEMENNAHCVAQYFLAKGWNIKAIAGLLGNMEQESTINPGLIEVGGTGHGLVQWTPPEDLYKVLDVLYGSHSNWQDGDRQCSVIYAEYEEATGKANRGIEKQWYATSDYPITWEEWASGYDRNAAWLALAFQANYERPKEQHLERADLAEKWLKVIESDSPLVPSEPAKEKKKGMPIYMYMIRRW